MKVFFIYKSGGVPNRKEISAESIKGQLKEVFNFEAFAETPVEIKQVFLSDETSLVWNSTLAHYCFAEGRISEEEFLKETTLKEGVSDEFR
jgi:hypothetical protein